MSGHAATRPRARRLPAGTQRTLALARGKAAHAHAQQHVTKRCAHDCAAQPLSMGSVSAAWRKERPSPLLEVTSSSVLPGLPVFCYVRVGGRLVACAVPPSAPRAAPHP